jgi:lipocalin
MARKKRYLTATMAHFWRIVAVIENGKTEVFWGHSKSPKEAAGKKTALTEAARQRGWASYAFEVVELTECKPS